MATATKKAKKSTAFSRLKKKKGAYCKGKATKADVRKSAREYVKSAVKKGKTRAEANKTANAVLKSGCSMTSIAGPKKKRKSPAPRKRK